MGEIYSPHTEEIGEVLNSPKDRTPLPTVPCQLLETPYIFNLQTLLAEALNRPVTVFNRLRHAIFTFAIESLALPIVVILALLINGVRLYYGGWGGHWGEALLGAAVGVALPLLPLSLPLAWLALNWIGTARILAMYHQAGRLEVVLYYYYYYYYLFFFVYFCFYFVDNLSLGHVPPSGPFRG
ncbi:Transmembrane protein 94 [Portunus trituberculatus]|uniref:Transmembrane protein 94 n=1 Tax=Portunus trituberculatus TaxID=210409 RepID=A0A5B7I8I9_PORTR|nr:Transmembrane protein 94 [Portunus trituberculatus]